MIQNVKLEKSMKEANNKKVLSLSIAIGFLIIIFIVCACVLAFKPALENDNIPVKDGINTSYFDSPQEWSPSSGVCNQPSLKLLGASEAGPFIPSGCTLYTYDNNFDVYSRPNTKNVISDYLNKLVQAEELPDTEFCVDRDQIVAQKVVHTCNGPNCLSVFGNNIKKGVEETFSAACVQNNNICKDLLASISFNFRLYQTTDSSKVNDVTNTITDTTVCLSVKNIRVPNRIFTKIPQFYKDSGIFTLSTKEDITVYPAIITFENCNPLDYRQKFRIQRYTYTSEAGAEPGFVQTSGKDNTGFFCNIIYRIGNLRLSYDEDNETFCFIDNDNRDPNWLLMPELDLRTNIVSTIQRYQMSNYFTENNPYYKKGVSLAQVASQKGPFFANFISSSNNLEVIDTSNNPDPESFRYINLENMDDSDPKVNRENVVFAVYYTLDVKNNTIQEVYDETDSDSDSDSDINPITGAGNVDYNSKPSIPQDNWENVINVATHVYKPTFGEGPGRIYHRYQMVQSGEVANTLTFFSTLDSKLVYYLKFLGASTAFGRIRDSYLSVYTGMSPAGINSNGTPKYATGIKYLGTVKDQHYIQDGEALWRRVPLYEGIKHFSSSYFIDNNFQGDPIKNIKQQPISGTTSPVKYVTPETGLISLIDFSNSTIDNPIPVEDLPNLPPIGISSASVINNNPDAEGLFYINFGLNPENQSLEVESFSILNAGKNNTNNPVDIPIPGSSMTVKGAKFVTANQDIIYQAVPGVSGSGGATFSANITSNGTSLENVNVLSRGYGYNEDEIVYIVQTDSSGIVSPQNNLPENIKTLDDFSKYPDETKKLVSVKVSTEPFVGAKYNLLRPDVSSTNLSGYFDYYPYFNKSYDGIPSYLNNQIFGKSPPQIAFLGHDSSNITETMILAKLNLVNSTNPADFIKFFSSNSSTDEPITNTDYIKTIQFRDLNYTLDDSANFFTNTNSNQLSSGDNPVLGRFIPYRHFSTLNDFESDNVNSQGFMYNNNYTQFIPYGLKHIYETYINLKDLPSF